MPAGSYRSALTCSTPPGRPATGPRDTARTLRLWRTSVDVDEIAAATTMLLDGALVAAAEHGDGLDRREVCDRIVRTAVAISGMHPAAR